MESARVQLQSSTLCCQVSSGRGATFHGKAPLTPPPPPPSRGSQAEESGHKTAFLAKGRMLTDVTVKPVKRRSLAGFDRVDVIQEPKQLWDLIPVVHFKRRTGFWGVFTGLSVHEVINDLLEQKFGSAPLAVLIKSMLLRAVFCFFFHEV